MAMGNYIRNGDLVDVSTIGEALLPSLLKGSLPAYLWTTIASRSLYEAVGPFDPTLERCEDLDFMLRLVKSGKSIRVIGGEPLVDYNFTLRGRSGQAAEAAMQLLLTRYEDEYRELTDIKKFKARRLWQISDYYRANAQQEDMWRCRCQAAVYDFDTYFQKLIVEVVAEGKKHPGKR